jgi:protein-disulfide isomerase
MNLRVFTIIAALLCVVGLADSAYLTWDHFSHHASTDYDGGMCGVGGGCDLARTSSLSEVPMPGWNPGLPIALLGFSFYAAWAMLLVLFGRRARANDNDAASRLRALMVVLAGAGLAYSLFLGSWSLMQGSLCPFCSVLYVVNALLFGLTLYAGRLLPGRSQGVVPAFLAALRGRPAFLAALVFLGVTATGYVVYRGALVSAVETARRAPPPAPGPKVEFNVDGRPAKGPETARIHLVEFADFECPHCANAFEGLGELAGAFPEDVRVTYLHFPLDEACNRLVRRKFHPRACHLARLAECAHTEGRYVDAARLIYEKRRELDDAAMLEAIVGLGVDRARLEACLADDGSISRVKADIELGLDAGVQGTPTIYLNGEQLRGPLTEDAIRELLGTLPKAAP